MNKDKYDSLTWSSKGNVILTNLRVVPRVALSLYGYVCWQSYEWFISIPDPTTQQTTFVTLLWGASAAWFNFYLTATRKRSWPDDKVDEKAVED